ncbi:MAG: glycosyltransferase family 2 protein [Bdellovibrionaceae bacterium]|nr:glycosyltransferase family 2 protein [Pseudobdellovibrionaceae bacterium]MBX3032776.1 glycosyltransferase family 2 protein [Pseudobdellovibrionaceae bacterium]
MSEPKSPSTSLSIVIPCLNEEEAIDAMMPRLQEVRENFLRDKIVDFFEVIVVDDGSQDDSVRKLLTYPWLHVIQHRVPQGYGATLKQGFRAAGGEWIGFFDLDFTYDPRDLKACFREVTSHKADIVYGTRLFWSQGMPLIRGFGNFVLSSIVRWVFGRGVSDIATGFRVFHRERLPEVLALPEKHFDFGFSFTMWTLNRRWKIVQVPISYSRRRGRSKLHALKDGLVFFRVLIQQKKSPRSR